MYVHGCTRRRRRRIHKLAVDRRLWRLGAAPARSLSVEAATDGAAAAARRGATDGDGGGASSEEELTGGCWDSGGFRALSGVVDDGLPWWR